MANKNHELDKPIIEAAKAEFLKNGFQSTSINNIAKRLEEMMFSNQAETIKNNILNQRKGLFLVTGPTGS